MKSKFDKGTIIGFVVAIVALLGSVLIEGGSPLSYVNLSAGLIVFGGSIGIVLISYPLSTALKLPKVFRQALREPPDMTADVIRETVRLAERARKEGLLALEQEAQSLTDPLLHKGVMLVVDGTDPEVVKAILEVEIATREARHETGIAMFEALGGFAPTLGILGTVMGLIRILSHIGSANEMAASIAVAFTATLYGVGSANLFWLPIANRLKRRTAQEMELAALVIDGVMAIQAGDNPRIVQEKLSGYATPTSGKKAKAATADADAGATAGAPARAGA